MIGRGLGGRWVVLHGRTDQPGYRFVCTRHWFRFMAVDLAGQLQHHARVSGWPQQTYWAERARPGDVPGSYLLDDGWLGQLGPERDAK